MDLLEAYSTLKVRYERLADGYDVLMAAAREAFNVLQSDSAGQGERNHAASALHLAITQARARKTNGRDGT